MSAESARDLISVWICASSPAVRSGLRALLSNDSCIAITAEQASPTDWGSPEFVQVVVLAVSVFTPALTHFLKGLSGTPRIMLISDEPFVGWLETPAIAGVLLFTTNSDQLCAAVRAAAVGLRIFDPLRPPQNGLQQAGTSPSQKLSQLTERENQVLQLLSEGLSNKQIALQMSISTHTIKFHISTIFSKLGANNRTEAVRMGIQNGIIHL